MFVAMTAVGLTTLALLTLDLQHSTGQHCSEGEREQIWSSLPQCQPRDTLVALPLPKDPTILQVTPCLAWKGSLGSLILVQLNMYMFYSQILCA